MSVRSLVVPFLLSLGACAAQGRGPAAPVAARGAPSTARAATPAQPRPTAEVVATAASRVTAAGGVRYTAPAGWTITTREAITIVSAQDGDLHLAIEETRAQDAAAALAEAWRRYGAKPPAHVQFVVGDPVDGKRRLVLRDARPEYVFVETK